MERVIPKGTTITARMHDAKVRQAISARGKNTPRKGYGSTPPEADGIQLLPGRQQTAHRSGQGKSDHAARSVDDQVVHIKQTVATLIDKVQTAELGQLKKQR